MSPVPGPARRTIRSSALPATAGDADDYIFVHNSTVTGGITLQNGQKLYGEALRALDQSEPERQPRAGRAWSRPEALRISTATTGNAVGVLANTANGNLTNVEIRGLTLSTTAASSNAIDITSADAANVAVTISGVVVTGATAEGIDINQGSTRHGDGVDDERHRDLHRHRHRSQRDGRHLDGDRLQRHHHHRRHRRVGHRRHQRDLRRHRGWRLQPGGGRRHRRGHAGESGGRCGRRADQRLRRPGVHRPRHLHGQRRRTPDERHRRGERGCRHRHTRDRRVGRGDTAVDWRPGGRTSTMPRSISRSTRRASRAARRPASHW